MRAASLRPPAGPRLTFPAGLYVVATPIGNAEDLSPRAARLLREAGLVACEDTRRTRRLLSAGGIPAPNLIRYDEHTHDRQAPLILEQARGKPVCLVTDSGTPSVSDPGARLVRRALEEGIRVSVVPGPSAVTAALACSGTGAGGFVFLGFLPKKPGPAKRTLAEAGRLRLPVIFFEHPARTERALQAVEEVFGEKARVVACRELTKEHEEILAGSVPHLRSRLTGARGEITFLVEPSPTP